MPTEIVIFDMDGTLADCAHRQHYLTGPKKDWDAFYEAMDDDPPNTPIITLAKALNGAGHHIVVCTGRPAKYRARTRRWLHGHGVFPYEMYTRADGDFRDDTVVKREMLSLIRVLFEPILVVDDRAKVVAMWREEGLTCLQCAPGEF